MGDKGKLATMIIIAGALLVTILYTVYEWIGMGEVGTYEILSDMTQTIGNLLFTEWGAVVLVLGFILFAAMLGGVYIAQEDDE
jgi:NADH:ubiquinone oxidoreductase subunit 6 (subunit J)